MVQKWGILRAFEKNSRDQKLPYQKKKIKKFATAVTVDHGKAGLISNIQIWSPFPLLAGLRSVLFTLGIAAIINAIPIKLSVTYPFFDLATGRGKGSTSFYFIRHTYST